MNVTALRALPVAGYLPLAEKVTLTLVVDPRETKTKEDLLGDLPTLVPFLERKLRNFDPAVGQVSGYVRCVPCMCATGVRHPDTLALELEIQYPFALMPGETNRRLLVYVMALQQK